MGAQSVGDTFETKIIIIIIKCLQINVKVKLSRQREAKGAKRWFISQIMKVMSDFNF